MGKSRSTVVEVCDDLYSEIRELALLNDLRIYEVTNAVIEEVLKDQERFYCSGGCSLVYTFVRC